MKIHPLFPALLILATAFARGDDKDAVAQARATFTRDDAVLNKVFKETVAGLDKAKAAALQKKETAWVAFREERSAGKAKAAGAKADAVKESPDYWQSMISYTVVRTDFLKTYTGKGLSAGIDGDYTDTMDGDLQLEERTEGLFFTFSAVRGDAQNTGQLTGIAQEKGGKAHFKGEAEDGKKACEIN
ncbi:MAG TPA: lysozyme inhibitor LprI family protein, partial [Chthoniobacteraceae bacterium]|nr:lysozyme inhibitor LprI family protein [Chthoniobacteraceae bacterium]